MRKIVVATILLTLTIFGTDLQAQDEYLHSPTEHTVSALDVNPGRPVVLGHKESAAYTGLAISMSKDSVFEGWLLPLGWGYGFYPNLELGFDTNLLLDLPANSGFKWENAFLISDFRLYARYVILEGMLAANLSLIIPTALKSTFGFDILIPAKYKIAGFEFFGNLRFDFRSPRRGFLDDDVILFGLAVSGLYLVYDGLFVILDTGFSYRNTDANEIIVPLGFGVGYKVAENTLVKAAFTFPNIAADDNAFDSRFIQLVVVQNFDLSAPGK